LLGPEQIVHRSFLLVGIRAGPKLVERAEVAPETVYSIYRTKAALLDAVVRGAVRRDDAPEDPLDRRWVKHLLRLPDLSSRITGFARHTAQTTELTSPIYAVIASAGTGDEELHELQGDLLDMRFAGQRQIMIALALRTAAAPGPRGRTSSRHVLRARQPGTPSPAHRQARLVPAALRAMAGANGRGRPARRPVPHDQLRALLRTRCGSVGLTPRPVVW
jgi:AcrR family transcriptional regulator